MGIKKPNWLKLQREYVEGIRESKGEYPIFPSLTEIAKRNNVNIKALGLHCQKEAWVKKRTEFIAKLEKVVSEKHIKSFSDESIKFDNKCYKMAMSGLQDIEDKITFFKDIAATKPPEESENKGKILDTLNIDFYDKAARTIERFQRIGRIALGMSPNNNDSNPSYNNIKIISFSEGLDKVMKQLKSDPKLLEKIQDDLSD